MPPAITATVPPSSAPLCAAVSMPRARPETTTMPASARSAAIFRAIRMPSDEAFRAPTIATSGRARSAEEPRAHRSGGASGMSASAAG